MTPAERAVAWGLVVEPVAPAEERAWWTAGTDCRGAAVWYGLDNLRTGRPGRRGWWHEMSRYCYATENTALTAYLDAVGAP